jgi:hypothetical protein
MAVARLFYSRQIAATDAVVQHRLEPWVDCGLQYSRPVAISSAFRGGTKSVLFWSNRPRVPGNHLNREFVGCYLAVEVLLHKIDLAFIRGERR